NREEKGKIGSIHPHGDAQGSVSSPAIATRPPSHPQGELVKVRLQGAAEAEGASKALVVLLGDHDVVAPHGRSRVKTPPQGAQGLEAGMEAHVVLAETVADQSA